MSASSTEAEVDVAARCFEGGLSCSPEEVAMYRDAAE
jgi:hypothetical protein